MGPSGSSGVLGGRYLEPLQLAVDGRPGDAQVPGGGLAVPAGLAQRSNKRFAFGPLKTGEAPAAGGARVAAGQIVHGDVTRHRARQRGGHDLAELTDVAWPFTADQRDERLRGAPRVRRLGTQLRDDLGDEGGNVGGPV